MTVKIETNGRGEVEIWGENSRGQKHVVEANRIFVRASDGHVFLGPSIPQDSTLARLTPLEATMVEHWWHEKGAGIEANIFAGEPPRG